MTSGDVEASPVTGEAPVSLGAPVTPINQEEAPPASPPAQPNAKTTELLNVVDDQEAMHHEEAPPRDSAQPNTRTTELLKVVDDQEDQDQPHVFRLPSSAGEEDEDWGDIFPPPKPEDLGNVDEAGEPMKQEPPETAGAATAATVATAASVGTGVSQEPPAAEPDFSKYKTHIAERLWRAQEAADKSGLKHSSDLVPLTKEYQVQRKKLRNLMRAANEYRDAMRVVAEKKSKLFEQYAVLAKDTPLWEHIGKPLTPEQATEIRISGGEVTPDSIELQTKAIMKVTEEIEAGSLIALLQLSVQHERLNVMDYQTHILDYLDEWDEVVTSLLDDEVKTIRDLNKQREHYIYKVDRLRGRVNRIERKGVKDAPERLTEKLGRNEDKLQKADADYEEFANDVAVSLNEVIRRGWVDLYPLIKSAMKFEVNRIGRDNATFGRLPGTLDALKSDYKEAVRGSADENALKSDYKEAAKETAVEI